MFAMTQIAQAQIANIISSGISSIISIHSFGDGAKLTLFGQPCTSYLKGRIRKFQWVWDSKISCNGKFGGLTGSASGYKSKSGAINNAVTDFVNKAIANGSLTIQELQALGK